MPLECPTSGQGDREATESSWLFGTAPKRIGVLCASVVLFFLVLEGCGYRVAGRGSRLPASLKTIAVPTFENHTPRYRIEQRLTAAVAHELLARTSYRIVPDPGGADAVLHGEVTSIESSTVLFDTATGRATTLLITLRAKVRLNDQETQSALYQNDSFLFREPYEISTDVAGFFEEGDPALDRLARDFASRLVAAILENF